MYTCFNISRGKAMVKNSQVRVSVVLLMLLFSSLCLVVWTQQPTTSNLKTQINSPENPNTNSDYTLSLDNSEYTPALDLIAKAKPPPKPTTTATPRPSPPTGMECSRISKPASATFVRRRPRPGSCPSSLYSMRP